MVTVTIPGGVLHKFLFEGLPVRGMLVRLTDGWQELVQRAARNRHHHHRQPLSFTASRASGNTASNPMLP